MPVFSLQHANQGIMCRHQCVTVLLHAISSSSSQHSAEMYEVREWGTPSVPCREKKKKKSGSCSELLFILESCHLRVGL